MEWLVPQDPIFPPVSIQLKLVNDRAAQTESIPRTFPSVRPPQPQKCRALFILFIGFADSDSRDRGAGGEASGGSICAHDDEIRLSRGNQDRFFEATGECPGLAMAQASLCAYPFSLESSRTPVLLCVVTSPPLLLGGGCGGFWASNPKLSARTKEGGLGQCQSGT